MSDKALNAGVQAVTGFEFQKNVALYLFLENYDNYSKKDFFICIEHHDDFLYCFKNDAEELELVETYQAKKASKKWSLDKIFYEILIKIINVGIALKSDSISKSSNYTQKLYFTSNEHINLNVQIDNPEKKGKKKNISAKVSESNSNVNYNSLHDDIKKKIVQDLKNNKANDEILEKLNELNFLYIDFPKTTEKQVKQLIGSSTKLFGDKIADHEAAIYTLLQLFRNIETFYNQGEKAKLLDERKRVTSKEILDGINIITTQKKAYNLWRQEKDKIPNILQIPVSEHEDFVKDFLNSFDFFKDQTQAMHATIINFVKQNKHLLDQYYNDCDCINALLVEFKKNYSTLLIDRTLKAALFAAYVEVRG